MAIQHVSPDTDIDVILDIIERDAAVVIDDVLTKKDLDDIKAELGPYLKNDIEGDNEFTGFQTKRVGALMARSPKCRELALDPTINALSAKFLEPHCDGYNFISHLQFLSDLMKHLKSFIEIEEYGEGMYQEK